MSARACGGSDGALVPPSSGTPCEEPGEAELGAYLDHGAHLDDAPLSDDTLLSEAASESAAARVDAAITSAVERVASSHPRLRPSLGEAHHVAGEAVDAAITSAVARVASSHPRLRPSLGEAHAGGESNGAGEAYTTGETCTVGELCAEMQAHATSSVLLRSASCFSPPAPRFSPPTPRFSPPAPRHRRQSSSGGDDGTWDGLRGSVGGALRERRGLVGGGLSPSAMRATADLGPDLGPSHARWLRKQLARLPANAEAASFVQIIGDAFRAKAPRRPTEGGALNGAGSARSGAGGGPELTQMR